VQEKKKARTMAHGKSVAGKIVEYPKGLQKGKGGRKVKK